MAELPYLNIFWKQHQMYRGFQLWQTVFNEKTIYAVSVGYERKVSLDLEEVHKYVDDYFVTKLN